MEILVTWIGYADLASMRTNGQDGIGPIAQACTSKTYDETILLSSFPLKDNNAFVEWIAHQTKAQVSQQQIELTSPTNYSEIYSATSSVIELIFKNYKNDVTLTFNVSSGTSAMAAVWVLLSTTKYHATLVESSKEHGVKEVDIPFAISVDFLPDLYKQTEKNLNRLAAGIPIEAPEFKDIIHRSKNMQHTIHLAQRVAIHSLPVLIEGESGTGKELFARAIHNTSERKGEFISINCGAIPTELVESELFGHEKGSFTGATEKRTGHFEAAHGGTIFLDEIGELPKEIQVKLLRVIQEHEVKAVGATESKTVDLRVVTATNRTLIDEVGDGSFREDLFYRLAVAVIVLPPLRNRTEDISLLTEHFLKQINKDSKNVPG
ncbi:MAG: sigma-54-dependent Fis family transcriptional regulator, partial [Bacteroides sp.]|nr:sigma-54-dependent Fis family transcriptional regulator [Bacteroides sp.]